MKQRQITSIPEESRYLNSAQLDLIEQSFREWAEKTPRKDVRLARQRILIIFLLIRYTGARLNEVLALNPFTDIDFSQHLVTFGSEGPEIKGGPRKVRISTKLSAELKDTFANPYFKTSFKSRFNVDPGFVRRKFYERAQACGFPKNLGGPDVIRKSRAVELMQGNMPLPAVQKMLGHSTLNPATSYVSFSTDDIQRVTELFLEREASRKTSARNAFFGKIETLQKGDIQTRVTLTSIGGYAVTTVITNDSAEQLGLKKGLLVTAQIKAPWVILYKGEKEPRCSAENKFSGTVEQISEGKVNTEFIVRITDGTQLCALVSTKGARPLGLETGAPVWAVFNCFAVILDVD